jgi:ABC-type transport system involved in multi-copper enzyme maturation permease subunit
MNKVLAIAGVVIKELYRRKDFYVLFVLTAVITLVMGSVSFFNDTRMVRYVKDIALLLIWISALVIAIATTARQIPAERESRTIFPLLAKPALIVLYLFFVIASGTREHHWPLLNYCQAMWLQWVMLGVVVAFVLLGSVVFTAPSSNATISFIVVLGILFLGRYLNQVALQQPEPLRTVVYGFYFLIPHLEWYDVRDLIIYDQHLVGWVDCGLATLYAVLYMAVFLVGAWLVFRRKPLSV